MAIKGNERKGKVKGTGKGTGQDGMTITKLPDNEKKESLLTPHRRKQGFRL